MFVFHCDRYINHYTLEDAPAVKPHDIHAKINAIGCYSEFYY